MATKRNIAVGIDIGTYHVKVVVAQASENPNEMPKILGVGFTESKGLRHGYIIHQSDAIRSIRKAVLEAQKKSGVKISKAFLAIGGVGLGSYTATGSISISRADNEITDLDIEKILSETENQIPSSVAQNKKIVHTIPTQYKIDGKEVLGKSPVGMKGVRLEAKVLFITSLEHHLSELIQAVEDAGVEIIDVMAAPLAASLVSLTKTEKMVGSVLANIGSETVSIVIYEDDIPISLEVFPIGSSDITNDIALGLQVPIDEAEDIKKKSEQGLHSKHPKKKLEDIISARLSDIFELIESHLKKINKSGLLPGGIVITGGGSGITTAEDLAKAYLKLPAKVSKLVCNEKIAECLGKKEVEIKDGTWAVSYGLCVFGLYAEGDDVISLNVGKQIYHGSKKKLVGWIKQFLP